jgi:CheY-like chemotaxis protein
MGLDAQRLPAAAITAFVRSEDRERALDAGYQACLHKPIDPTLLARTVRQLIDRAPVSAGARTAAMPPLAAG